MQRNNNHTHKGKNLGRMLATLGVVALLATMPVAVAQTATGTATSTASGDLAGDASGDLAGDASGDITGDASGDLAGDASGDLAGDASGDVTGDLAGEFTTDATADAATKLDASTDLESDVQVVTTTAAELEADAFTAAAAAEAEASGLFGAIQADGDARAGAFVHFQVASDGKAIVDHRSQGAATFSEVRLSGQAQQEATAGATTSIWTDQAQLEAHDDAEATLLVKARSQTQATFKMAADAQARIVADDQARVTAQGQEGVLAIQGEGRLSQDASGNIVAELQQGSSIRFEAQSSAEADSNWYLEQKAYATGRLGAEAAVVRADGEAAMRAEEYVVDLEAKAIEQGNVRVAVSSEDPRPRVIVLDMDADLFASSDVRMLHDGQEAVRASSVAEVYAATEASQATYAIAEAEGKMQAHVHVPSFSTHEVAFVEDAPSEPSQDAPVPALALGVLALIGAALVRRH